LDLKLEFWESSPVVEQSGGAVFESVNCGVGEPFVDAIAKVLEVGETRMELPSLSEQNSGQ
jgi:hypothetical protein